MKFVLGTTFRATMRFLRIPSGRPVFGPGLMRHAEFEEEDEDEAQSGEKERGVGGGGSAVVRLIG